MSLLDDPCPLPDQVKKRSLNEKERLIYAPMSGVGGFVYDRDGIHIDASHLKVCAWPLLLTSLLFEKNLMYV